MNISIVACVLGAALFGLSGCTGAVSNESAPETQCYLTDGVGYAPSPPSMVVDVAQNDQWSYLNSGSDCPVGAACFVWASVSGETMDGGVAYSLVGQGKCQ